MEVVKAKIVEKPKPIKVPKPKRIWDNYKVIGEVQKSDNIKIVFAAALRDGVRYINIREFYLKKSEQVWKPGRDGITVPIVVPINKGTELIKPFKGFLQLLEATSLELIDMSLYNEENAVYYLKEEKK